MRFGGQKPTNGTPCRPVYTDLLTIMTGRTAVDCMTTRVHACLHRCSVLHCRPYRQQVVSNSFHCKGGCGCTLDDWTSCLQRFLVESVQESVPDDRVIHNWNFTDLTRICDSGLLSHALSSSGCAVKCTTLHLKAGFHCVDTIHVSQVSKTVL